MAKYKRTPSKIISFVLMITFGLLAAIIGYATFKGGAFELRSKAASEEILIKRWTFDKSVEGWVAKDFGKSTVSGGNLVLVVGPKSETVERRETCTGSEKRGNYTCKTTSTTVALSPRIEQGSADVTLRYPINKFKIRLSLNLPPTPKPGPTCTMPPPCAFLKRPCKYVQQGVNYCPLSSTPQKGDETVGMPKSGYILPSGSQRVVKVPIQVSYRLQGKKDFETPVSVVAVSDGVMHDFSFDFPKTLSLKRIDQFKVSFADLRKEANASVSVSDISVVGLKEVLPTVTTTPPNPAQTFMGTVSKVEKTPSAVSPYVLFGSIYGDAQGGGRTDAKVAYIDARSYQLLAAKTNAPCPLGAFCKMIARPLEINFEQYVGKQVIVSGTVVYQSSGGKGTENPSNIPDKEGTSVPILYVTSIKLVDTTKPCQPLPTGCIGTDGSMQCKVALMEGYQWCPTSATPTPGTCGPDGAACTIGTCPQPACETGKPCPYVACKLQSGICKGNQCVSTAPTPTPWVGCYYQQVQCYKAPCDPILVCPTPTGFVGCETVCEGTVCHQDCNPGI